jgi:hypothetical protein
MQNYILQNLVAIIALLISIVSLIIGIVTRREAKLVQLEEKNSEMIIKYVKTIEQVELIMAELENMKDYHDRIMKLLLLQNNSSTSKISPKRIQLTKAFIELGENINEEIASNKETKENLEGFLEANLQKKIKSLSELAKIIGSLEASEQFLKSIRENHASLRNNMDITMQSLMDNSFQ